MAKKWGEISAGSDQERLVEASRELRNILYALDQSAIVAVTDRAGTIIHVNDKFCQISKYSRDELLGQSHRIINSDYHSKDFFIRMWKTISSGKIFEAEIKNKAKDGTFYWVNTVIVPFLGSDGKPHEYVSIRYDITERKLAEEQRREMEAQIIVQDRLASVGLLASSLAHEIGNPLGVIRGRAEYLSQVAGGAPQVAKSAEIIITQIDRVSKLIRSLLNLARGDEQKRAGTADLKMVVEEVVELMAHEFRKNSIEVKNQLGHSLPVIVSADSQPLHQVLLNLLVNSVHAIGTAKKQGRSDGHFIELSGEEMGDHWVLTVHDSGCGISEENLANLFRPFFTTKEIGQGTGLGLATSYRIVEAWGGSIRAESREGEGATFKVRLRRGTAHG